MIKPLAAGIQQPAQNSGTRTPADNQAAYKRGRELEEAARPMCADCGVLRGFLTRRGRNDKVCRPATFALCHYCFGLAEPGTERDRVDRRLAVMRAWRQEMRSRR